MSSINSISGSALQAFGTSQQVTANNLANLKTDGFKASRVALQEKTGGGVTATTAGTQDAVDISREATNLIANAQNFKTNLTVIKAADEMTKQLLSIKA